MSEIMKIAVTAVNGKLGTEIAKKLIEELGFENVIGIARSPEKANHLGIEIRKGDYNSIVEFKEALKGIDSLVLISGMDLPKKRIQQHRNVIEAAEYNNVKKLVYTSIIGESANTTFDPVIKSNRQTEIDIQNSTLKWVIGRNGLYIEPDIEYLKEYQQKGFIMNNAGDAKCSYTSKEELASAYVQMILNDELRFKTYNLTAKPITQIELAESFNTVYKTNLKYRPISTQEFWEDRKKELDNFMASVVTGIYEGISKGVFNVSSDFFEVVGREHASIQEIMKKRA